ncbi:MULTISPECIES: M12 family metallopeptidase [unclassified Spirosoma]|uniref:M12 family metallopeptidase n=1 Tax=unclassified Spirosoma TaxID=2621999 RepID=UPI00095B724D|nr:MULTISPECIES: M12 family metallopeptidase [unclassified Spirosoma]MBN8826799.1 M12 family metallopeptidase [Spirosoma sp.]OJW73629.1 MAG: peptidase M12 [Spirosoma sp. 48-14]
MKNKLSYSLFFTLITLSIGCSPEVSERDLQSVKPTSVSTRPEEAFPNQRGSIQSAKLNGQTVIYQLFGDQAVFESDILLSEHDLRQADDLQVEGTGRTKASSRWPNKIVYYSISPSLPNPSRVLDAIAHWEANTPIRFVERTTQRGYVLFQTGSGCSANVGYVGSVQYVNLASACTTGNTIHEIGHTIGLWHEHSRADRDTYVNINTSNIITGYETDFQTYVQRGTDGFDSEGGLDFGSVMMYGSYDFSKNGLPTITKKDGSTFTSQRNGLSQTDIQTVNLMYPTPN